MYNNLIALKGRGSSTNGNDNYNLKCNNQYFWIRSEIHVLEFCTLKKCLRKGLGCGFGFYLEGGCKYNSDPPGNLHTFHLHYFSFN